MTEGHRTLATLNALTLHEVAREVSPERELVQFTLKVKQGTGPKEPVYKIKVTRFHSGTVDEWIDILDALDEIWKQNSLNKPNDMECVLKLVVRDEALTTYEASIDDQRQDDDGILPLTADMIYKGLEEVSVQVFPHRALENQKFWMRRFVTKPRSMTVRQLFAGLTKMNFKLSRFPGGSEKDYFSAQELLGIVEFALPKTWQSKFDLQGYTPTLHDKLRLIQECEAIERSEAKAPATPKASVPKPKKQKGKRDNNARDFFRDRGNPEDDKYFCTEHGKNPTHTTANCFTIKNRKKQLAEKNGTPSGKNFSSSKFRKEIHTLSKNKDKRKILDLYSAVIKTERAKVHKAKKRKVSFAAAKKAEESGSEYEYSTEEEFENNEIVIHSDDSEDEINSRIEKLGLVNKE